MSENREQQMSDTITLNRSLVVGVIVGVLALAAGLAIGFFWGQDSANALAEARITAMEDAIDAIQGMAGGSGSAEAAPQQPTAAPTLASVDVDDDPFLGGEDAKVVLVEFSDFRCGYCKRFYDETLPVLLETYGDDLKFVYRDFPVVGGAQAAVAAECADEQDRFWDFHNALFDDPAAYSSQEDFEALAGELGLDVEAFSACFVSEEVMTEITADATAAQAAGVTGTPTFFINGTRIIGARPVEDFIAAIDAALEAAGG